MSIESLILHDGDGFAVLSKPSGIVTGDFVQDFAQKVAASTFQEASRALFGDTWAPHPCHQLDRGTSGCLIVGFTSSVRRRLCGAFKNRLVEKNYLALVCGVVTNGSGEISEPLKTEKFKFDSYSGRCRTIVDPLGKPAETYYEVLGTDGEFSLLHLKPLTGRTHQLRVHCASILNTPILGDGWYNTNETNSKPPLFLHAHQINIPDARSEGMLTVKAPLPSHIRNKVAHMNIPAATLANLGLGTH